MSKASRKPVPLFILANPNIEIHFMVRAEFRHKLDDQPAAVVRKPFPFNKCLAGDLV